LKPIRVKHLVYVKVAGGCYTWPMSACAVKPKCGLLE
jgi:hypothetical protein